MLSRLSMLLHDEYSKRLVFSLVLLSTIALLFWTQSRVPDLSDKAIMGGGILLEDPLSFEAKYPIHATDPVWKRILLTTVNWVFTNLRGMTFGVFFGAAFLCMLRYLPKRGFKNGFANAVLGLFVGAPLGVCVNCAAPIARGIYSGGARLETTLAAMIASPTFNVIVLTMLLSLLPIYMAVIKIGLTLVVILVAVPIICRLLPAADLQVADEEVTACLIDPVKVGGESLSGAVLGFAKDFLRDFWFIVRMTVPLMFLAGFLGAAMATLLPVSMISEIPFNILTISGIVALGLFLPVPIAFDIILAAALMASGAPAGFVMALLFTLGIFSIYSYIIVAGSISLRAGTWIGVVIAVLGVGSAYMAEAYSKWEFERTLKSLSFNFDLGLVSSAHAAGSEPVHVTTAETKAGKITITKTPHNKRSPAGETHFSRLETWRIGIDRPIRFTMSDMIHPFMRSRGTVAAADIDNDGDQDVVMGDVHGGIRLYYNDGSARFTRKDIDLPEITNLPVFYAAPVDINNDSWIDLVITTHAEGNYVLMSDKGQFEAKNLKLLTEPSDAQHALSLAFGDLNKDGFLDAVVGNNSSLPHYMAKGEWDRNVILFNDQGKLSAKNSVETPGLPGETLSVIMSDINQDGALDLIEGNDFTEPDVFYFGDGKGGLRQITTDDGIIPVSTLTTMSVKTADFNNDLNLDIYVSQIAGHSGGLTSRLPLRPWEDYCPEMEREEDRKACEVNVQIREWYPATYMRASKAIADNCNKLTPRLKTECRALLMRNLAFRTLKPELCKRIPDSQKRIRVLCQTLANAQRHTGKRGDPFPKPGMKKIHMTADDIGKEIPQLFGGNVLLVNNGEGVFENQAEPANVEYGGWSWDVKVYDFDNDGLQDIHILNGDWVLAGYTPSKVLLRNAGKLKFEDKTDEFGLMDFLIVTATAAADYDNDGDIDQIAQTVNGPIIAYWNNSQSGNSIAFDYRDFLANRYGIGNKLIIRYGKDGTQSQIRELKLGGGFMSYDAPVIHFGLGDADKVSKIEIEWSNGGTSVIEGPFAANATYHIQRQ